MAVWRVPIFAATQTRCSAVDSFQRFLSPPCAVIATAMWSAETSQNALALKNKRVWWCLCTVKKRYNPGDKGRQLWASFCPECFTVCECREGWEGGERVRARGGGGRKCRAQRVWVGTLFSTERSPLFSTACLPHHRSYQATLSGPEWTRWHGSAELRPPPTTTTPLCSQPDSVCSSQLPPLSHSVCPPLHPEHLCSVSFSIFCVSPRSPAVLSIRPVSTISNFGVVLLWLYCSAL